MFRSSRVDYELTQDDDGRHRTTTRILCGHGTMDGKDIHERGRRRGKQRWRLEEPLQIQPPRSPAHDPAHNLHLQTPLRLPSQKRWILPGCDKWTANLTARSVTSSSNCTRRWILPGSNKRTANLTARTSSSNCAEYTPRRTMLDSSLPTAPINVLRRINLQSTPIDHSCFQRDTPINHSYNTPRMYTKTSHTPVNFAPI